MTPPLLAVIGPVEPDLLDAFTNHYRSLGIDAFHLAFHFPAHVHPDTEDHLLDIATHLPGPPPKVSRGPWHEHLHAQLRDELRTAAGPGWHLIADCDEFHAYPAPIADLIDAAEQTGSLIVGGLLLDRIATDGGLVPDHIGVDPDRVNLDCGYPLGGFLTADLLRGDPRKIVLADSRIELALGSHRSPGHQPVNTPLIPVHHFKWRPGIVDDLRRRVQHHSDGSWTELTPAIRTEASRLLAHLDAHGGRIDITGTAFRPVTLAETPPWWASESVAALARWSPPPATSTGRDQRVDG